MRRWGRGAVILALVLTGWALMAEVLTSLLSPLGGSACPRPEPGGG